MPYTNPDAASEESSQQPAGIPSSLPISPDKLQDLLRSTYTPPPASISQIPAILSSISGNIRLNETRLHRLRSEIMALENMQERLKYQQTKYRSLLAPVRRLPAELVDRIFRLYASFQSNHFGMGCFSHRECANLPGLRLMAVCSRWRDIAKSCTSLWTDIMLDLGFAYETQDRLEGLVVPMTWCLDYAGRTAPIHVDIRGSPRFDENFELDILKMVVNRASRWRRARLSFGHDFPDFSNFRGLAGREFTLLESLHIEPYEWSPAHVVLDLFRISPKLRELHVEVPFLTAAPSLPLTQIRELKLEYNRRSDIFNTSSLCPHLETLSYAFPYTWSQPDSQPVFPLHSSTTLQSLNVCIKHYHLQPKTFVNLLGKSRLPALKNWVVQFPDDWNEHLYGDYAVRASWPQSDVTAFLQTSGCSLTSIHIEDAIVCDSDMITLLMLTPELQQLKFIENLRPKLPSFRLDRVPEATDDVQPLTTAFIERLHGYGSGDPHGFGSPLVPKLKHLKLQVLGEWFDDDLLFVDVIRSRWVPSRALAVEFGIDCLTSVELVVLGRELDMEVYKPLLQLDEVGMMVELSSVISET